MKPPFARKLPPAVIPGPPRSQDKLLIAALEGQVDRMREQIDAQQQEIEILRRRMDTATDKQLLLMEQLIRVEDPAYVRVLRAKVEGVIEKLDKQRLTKTADMLRAMLRG